MNQICQISGEPGGNLVVRQSRLIPTQKMLVKKDYYDRGYEPWHLVVVYGRSLIDQGRQSGAGQWSILSKDPVFTKIIEKHLYFGPDITMKQLL